LGYEWATQKGWGARGKEIAIRAKPRSDVSSPTSPPEYAAPPSRLGETSDGAPIISSSALMLFPINQRLRANTPRRTTA
jgi:hypothetical protein